jgi:hypothetical protein
MTQCRSDIAEIDPVRFAVNGYDFASKMAGQ